MISGFPRLSFLCAVEISGIWLQSQAEEKMFCSDKRKTSIGLLFWIETCFYRFLKRNRSTSKANTKIERVRKQAFDMTQT